MFVSNSGDFITQLSFSIADGSTLPATPGVTTDNNQTKQAVVQDVNKKSDTEQKQVVPENKSDREEEMLLLGVSDSNENFDTVDDSILDEEPKKDSSAKSELQKGVNEHQSNAGSSGGGQRNLGQMSMTESQNEEVARVMIWLLKIVTVHVKQWSVHPLR